MLPTIGQSRPCRTHPAEERGLEPHALREGTHRFPGGSSTLLVSLPNTPRVVAGASRPALTQASPVKGARSSSASGRVPPAKGARALYRGGESNPYGQLVELLSRPLDDPGMCYLTLTLTETQSVSSSLQAYLGSAWPSFWAQALMRGERAAL